MKKFLIVAGVLAVIAAPAFAQSFDPEEGTGNAEPFAYGTQGHQGIDGEAVGGAYAQAPKSIKSMGKKEGASESPAEDIDQGAGELREYR
jgi:opacity protein-like surface antigen